MRFSYKAIDHDGKTIGGSYDAADREAVIAALTKQSLRPLVIRLDMSAGKKTSFANPFKPKVKLHDMVMFTRQLSTLISAGVPLPKSLSTLQDQTSSKYFKSVIGNITKDIEGGVPLGAAFGKFPDVFSDVYVNMVKAGEAGGILDDILKRLATQAEKDASIRKKVKGAMTYPLVILSVTVVAFFGLMIFIVPKIGKILTGLSGGGAKLPVYTQALLTISNFCTSNGVIKHVPLIGLIPIIGLLPNLVFVIAAVAVVVYLILHYIHTERGRYQFHRLLLKTPTVKVIITKVAIARFARIFSALTSAGVTVLEALQVTGGAIGNKVIEAELAAAAREVKNGRPLSEPLSKSKVFPPIVAQMLAVGEETGQIDTILVKIADFYEEDVDTLIDSLSSIIEPVMIILLGAAIGLIAISVMGPIASLSTHVSPHG